MKNSKRLFILMEIVLAIMVLVLLSMVFQENNKNNIYKVSVIIQYSDDNQWAAFKYGLKMAAQDHGIEMFVVSTEGLLTVEEEKRIIEHEVEHGADAVIVQPVPGADTEKMLKTMQKKVPVMLTEYVTSEDEDKSFIPTTQPDNYAMGAALAKELIHDYDGKLDGKTLGIFSETVRSEAVIKRERGFCDALKDTGARICWSVSETSGETGEKFLETRPKVDFVIALDDHSLTMAGKCSAANNLHGALVYGLGHSTEAAYYLDTGVAECLLVPDEFNVGYQSLTEVAKSLRLSFHKMKSQTVSYTVIRRDSLFSKENQEILFTMSQ